MNKNTLKPAVLAFFLLFFSISCQIPAAFAQQQQPANLVNSFTAHRIAHAGGGIDKNKYTNSIDALESNLKKGFQYFEIDFSFTKDRQLVCIHDWTHSFQRSFGFTTPEKITLEEFNYLVQNKSEFQKCTAYTLAEWMRANPAATIITDVKEDNIEALKLLLKTLPDAESRVIPQIYNPVNFKYVKELGFNKIIWTLYRYTGNNDEILDWVNTFPAPFAVTMPRSRAESSLPEDLKKRKIPTYVHTVNTAQGAEYYIRMAGFSEIYTDFLPPKK